MRSSSVAYALSQYARASTYLNMGSTRTQEEHSDTYVAISDLCSLLLNLHQSPLLLSLFSTALPLTRYTSPVLWAAADSIAAWALVRIWRLRSGAKSTTRDRQVAALYVHSSQRISHIVHTSHSYLFNPYILLPSLAFSTSSLENALSLLSVMCASSGKP